MGFSVWLGDADAHAESGRTHRGGCGDYRADPGERVGFVLCGGNTDPAGVA